MFNVLHCTAIPYLTSHMVNLFIVNVHFSKNNTTNIHLYELHYLIDCCYWSKSVPSIGNFFKLLPILQPQTLQHCKAIAPAALCGRAVSLCAQCESQDHVPCEIKTISDNNLPTPIRVNMTIAMRGFYFPHIVMTFMISLAIVFIGSVSCDGQVLPRIQIILTRVGFAKHRPA